LKFFFTIPVFLLLAAAGSFAGPAAAENTATCLQAFKATQSVNSYMAVWTRNHNGTTETSTVEMQKPDRFHESGEGHEMIAIGNKAWMKTGDGPWTPLPGSMNAGEIVSMNPGSFTNFHGTRTCTDAGMGLWHGQPAHIYHSTYTDPKLGSSNSTFYVMSDGYIHHMDFTTSRGNSSMDFSRFNEVTVKGP
jgi:hypothetical protein